jgi:DNA ligase (NAD+)
MIIPQIAENLTRSGKLDIPGVCPACGGATEIRVDGDAETLVCINEFCPAKKIKSFSHYVSRNAMNIDGMSEATLNKFIDCGFLDRLDDLYHLDRYREEIVSMEGFGEKSYNNLIAAVDASRTTTPARLINALGIPNIGGANARLICRYFGNDLDALMNSTQDVLVQIEGIGEVIADGIENYFKNTANCDTINRILKEIHFEEEENNEDRTLEGMVFVITGSLNLFANRDELKLLIEKKGGKVTGSVSAKTSYLINNDINSGSGKNKKAKSLGIPIITEEEFMAMKGMNTDAD